MLGKGRKSSAGRKNVNKRRNERRGEDIVGEEGRKETVYLRNTKKSLYSFVDFLKTKY